MIIAVSSVEQFREKINNHKTVLVDFYADWCEPCKWLDQILEEIKSKMPPGSVILKVDVEKHLLLQQEFSVMNIPVMILFINSQPVWRMNGFLMGDELLKVVQEHSLV